jgi:hypothetical protein
MQFDDVKMIAQNALSVNSTKGLFKRSRQDFGYPSFIGLMNDILCAPDFSSLKGKETLSEEVCFLEQRSGE